MFIVDMCCRDDEGYVKNLHREYEVDSLRFWKNVAFWLKTGKVYYGEIFDDVNLRLFEIRSNHLSVKRVDIG